MKIEKQNLINQDRQGADLLDIRKKTLKTPDKNSGNDFEWLTEHSRNFLASGYLMPGVTAEERIQEIADRAEEILKIDGFAEKFYGYMAQGFFSLASPVWSNFGKARGLPISCFGSHIDDDMGNS